MAAGDTTPWMCEASWVLQWTSFAQDIVFGHIPDCDARLACAELDCTIARVAAPQHLLAASLSDRIVWVLVGIALLLHILLVVQTCCRAMVQLSRVSFHGIQSIVFVIPCLGRPSNARAMQRNGTAANTRSLGQHLLVVELLVEHSVQCNTATVSQESGRIEWCQQHQTCSQIAVAEAKLRQSCMWVFDQLC